MKFLFDFLFPQLGQAIAKALL